MFPTPFFISLFISIRTAPPPKTKRTLTKPFLLGPGESGKSTIFKQMKIISLAGGFTQDELLEYKFVVFGNCITQMKVIVNAASKLGIEMSTEENRVNTSSSFRSPENPPLSLARCSVQSVWMTTFSRYRSQIRAERMAKLPPGGDSWSLEVAQDISALWQDEGIRQTYEQRDRAYQLNDSAA